MPLHKNSLDTPAQKNSMNLQICIRKKFRSNCIRKNFSQQNVYEILVASADFQNSFCFAIFKALL